MDLTLTVIDMLLTPYDKANTGNQQYRLKPTLHKRCRFCSS